MAGSTGRWLPLVLVALLAGAGGPLFSQENAGARPEGAGSGASGSDAAGSAASAYLLLYRQIHDAERALADKILGTGGAVDAADVEGLAELAQEARLSLFGDLIDRSALLLVLAEERLVQERLTASRAARVGEIMKSRELEARAADARQGRSAALWGTLGTSAASFALAFTFWYLSEWQDEQYFLAPTVDDAVQHRTYFKLFSWMSYLSAGVGVLSAGVAIPVLARRHPPP